MVRSFRAELHKMFDRLHYHVESDPVLVTNVCKTATVSFTQAYVS